MGKIKGEDTQPEIVVRRLLYGLGYRYRLHVGDLPGRPDIVLRPRRAVIFVHGCFWHRHHCGRAYNPKSRVAFWQAKFDANVRRDKKNRRLLTASGWRVLTIWECETKSLSITVLARRLERFLRSQPATRRRNLR